jgi:hypothetical protein
MSHALKQGRRVAFACWRGMVEIDWMRLPVGAIKGIALPLSPSRGRVA